MSKRRVYVLPDELYERIQAFCDREKHLSEVEAVRRLLSAGLDHFDTEEEFESRVSGLDPLDAAFTACGHPLVMNIGLSERRAQITLHSGKTIAVSK